MHFRPENGIPDLTRASVMPGHKKYKSLYLKTIFYKQEM